MLFGLKQNSSFTPSTLVGKTVPEFELNLYPIGKLDSNSFKNQERWTIINFWASSCYVCKSEAPELQAFYENVTLANKTSPQLISINIQENIERVHEWQQMFHQTFPVLLDRDGHVSILFGVTGTPETFFVDPHGIVRYRIAGAVSTNFILNFIKWFEKNPNASEEEAHKQFIESV